MLSRRTALAALAAALAAAGCGPNQCPMDVAYVQQAPTVCTAVTGLSYTFPVQLCEDCRYTSPNCQVDALGGNHYQLATQWQVCQDNQGCNFSQGSSCYQPTCTVTVPSAGTYTVSYITGTDTSGNFTTASFDIALGAPAPTCG